MVHTSRTVGQQDRIRNQKEQIDLAAQTQDATAAIQKASEGIAKLNLAPAG